jgi:hypothetical protein
MPEHFRAEVARECEELRADLRARGERAEHEADQLRAALAQVRTGTSQGDGTARDAAPRLADRAGLGVMDGANEAATYAAARARIASQLAD